VPVVIFSGAPLKTRNSGASCQFPSTCATQPPPFAGLVATRDAFTARAVLPQIRRIHKAWTGYVSTKIRVADAARPGVVRQERNPVTQPVIEGDEQRIVVGISRQNNLVHVAVMLSLCKV